MSDEIAAVLRDSELKERLIESCKWFDYSNFTGSEKLYGEGKMTYLKGQNPNGEIDIYPAYFDTIQRSCCECA